MNVSTTSGAMNSAEPTGVKRMGVLVGVAGLTTILLRSKSHILTGVICGDKEWLINTQCIERMVDQYTMYRDDG